MKRGRSTGAMTKTEAAWVDAVKRHGCVCCAARGYRVDPRRGEPPAVEAHHLLSGGIRRGHMHTVGLCLWHHRGRLIVEGWSHAMHRNQLGPALSEGSVPFAAAFGDDDTLMEKQVAILNRGHA